MKLNASEIIILIIFILIFLSITIFSISEIYKIHSHDKIHALGYEVLDNVIIEGGLLETSPNFYNIVRYKDGCVEYKNVPAEKYFEKVNKNETSTDD